MLRRLRNSLIYRLGLTAPSAPPAPGRGLLASLYIRGEGLEVGALNSPLSVPPHARVRYVDTASAEELRRDYPYLTYKEPDIVEDGACLASVADDSQDFLIACHLIEHIEDPISAFKNWFRVLKPGGILFLAIPDKRFTFDFGRPVTPWEHLKRDHEDAAARSRSREEHFKEFYRAILGEGRDEDVRRLASQEGGHTHFHVWTQVEMLEAVVRLRTEVGLDFEVECFASYGNEGTFVLRKGAREDRRAGEESLAAARSVIEGVLQKLPR